MATQTTDLAGTVVYLRHVDSHVPMLEDTEYEALVGDGKLVGRPNDVMAGPGSKWVHPRAEKYVYDVFGQQIRRTKMGRDGHARCVLLLPLDWYREQWDNGFRDDAFVYADIAYAQGDDKEVVHAARFLATRRQLLIGTLDRDKGMRMEFSSTGGVLQLYSPSWT